MCDEITEAENAEFVLNRREFASLGAGAAALATLPGCATASEAPTASRMAPQLGFQVPYAERVRRDADMLTMAVGLIVNAPQAEAILAAGRADLIAVGREMLLDPFWNFQSIYVHQGNFQL